MATSQHRGGRVDGNAGLYSFRPGTDHGGTFQRPAAAPTAALDTRSATGQLDSFIRMRADSSGRTVFAHTRVTEFAVVPDERPREIMKLDGFNAGRFAKTAEGGWEFISREVTFYKDPRSGAILKEWQNPLTNEKNTVLQVANDPVNSRYAAPKAGEAGRFPFMISGDDVLLRLGITLSYAWARTGPWLPWMKMGQRPGYLMYSGHGRKYASFEELPAGVKAATLDDFPLYASAPSSHATPNETS